MFGGRVSVLRSGMTDELTQWLEYFSGLLAPPQQTYSMYVVQIAFWWWRVHQ
jgi:hypothetical protein